MVVFSVEETWLLLAAILNDSPGLKITNVGADKHSGNNSYKKKIFTGSWRLLNREWNFSLQLKKGN